MFAQAIYNRQISVETYNFVSGALPAAILVVFLGIVLTMAIWTWRAWANLYGLGLAGLQHRPAWAVLCYFVPIANLFVPFRAMRELANRSAGEDEHQAMAGVGDVTSWWACTLGVIFIWSFQAAVELYNRNGTSYIVAPPFVELLMTLLGLLTVLGSAFFLFRIVGKVSNDQEELAEDLARAA